jgi:hypothetical protein
MKYAGRLTVLGTLCAGGLLLALAGCAATDASDRDDMYNKPNKALNDPFGYSPDMSDTDISGGGIGDYDSKGMQRDVDNAANP